jgi:hypothetical protein
MNSLTKGAVVELSSLYDETLESNLCNEVSCILLDTLELFINDFEAELKESQTSHKFIDHVFSLYLALLRRNQSESFLSR